MCDVILVYHTLANRNRNELTSKPSKIDKIKCQNREINVDTQDELMFIDFKRFHDAY